jgi:hypothetical protein
LEKGHQQVVSLLKVPDSPAHPGAPAPSIPRQRAERELHLQEVSVAALFKSRPYSVRLYVEDRPKPFYRVTWPGKGPEKDIYIAPARDGQPFSLFISNKQASLWVQNKRCSECNKQYLDPSCILCVYVMLDGRHIVRAPVEDEGEKQHFWATTPPPLWPHFWVFTPENEMRIKTWRRLKGVQDTKVIWDSRRLQFVVVPKSLKGQTTSDESTGVIRVAFYSARRGGTRSGEKVSEVFGEGEEQEKTEDMCYCHPARWVYPDELLGEFTFRVVHEETIYKYR